jgi:UDP-3-O-[3-hydroxymyristoyl] glucosamine N-acyltransferase
LKEQEPKRRWSLVQLAERVGGTVEGDPDLEVSEIAGVEEATPESLVRVEEARYLEAAVAGCGAALLIGEQLPSPGKPALRVRNPRLAFARLLALFGGGEEEPAPGIHPSAVIGEEVLLGDGVAVRAGVVVGDGCRLGDGVVLHPNVTLGEAVEIGAGTVLFAGVQVYPRVTIGARVRIHSGTVIGADGFGYVWDGAKHEKIPHVGTVRIGDDVEIGANCAVDRATTGVTVIGAGTKIDNQVQIGHNVQVGPHCLIVAQAALAGSATLGAGVVMGGQAALRDHVHVGDRAMIAGKSGVWNDLPAGGSYSGNPARRHMEEERSLVAYRRAPELLRRLRRLEREMEELKARLESSDP